MILDSLKSYADKHALRLHTPGHKGGLDPLDLTELVDGSFPNGYIANAEKNIANAYGARHARMLTGGSSQGVKAAIYYAAGSGIADINSHRSVFDGFALANRSVATVGVKDGVKPITTAEIDRAASGSARAVVVTSPTYFGYVADLESIKAYCKRKGFILIVDGAHGAHFGFSELLPESPAHYADVTNVSAHKTLRTLTQGAILLDSLEPAEHEKLMSAVDILGTTSPSYLLYASIENGVQRAREDGARYRELHAELSAVKAAHKVFLDNDDITRLVLDAKAFGRSANELNTELVRMGVYSELVTDRYIVFVFTAADDTAAVERFERAIYDLRRK